MTHCYIRMHRTFDLAGVFVRLHADVASIPEPNKNRLYNALKLR